MGIFEQYKDRYEAHKEEEFTIQEFLEICKNDPTSYANSAERLLNAIGTPKMVDTSQDPTLSRIFSNRVITRYPAFNEFYGMEEAIEQIVSYLKHAAQASDGDNWADDSPSCRQIMTDKILPLTRYYSYIEITQRQHQSLWREYETIASNFDNFAMKHIQSAEGIFPTFR